MDIKAIEGEEGIKAAAGIAALCHERLRGRLPFLPRRSAEHYLPKIGWMVEKGLVLGAWDGGKMEAFLGGFLIEDFRNAGPGCFSPDWCNGSADPQKAFSAFRSLYRAIAPLWIEEGGRLHSIATYSSEAAALEALSLSGFGRIVMDAAAPAAEVAAGNSFSEAPGGFSLRRAEAADAEGLESLSDMLAAHIGASPVLMPDTRGPSAAEWREWLAEPDAVAFAAEGPEGLVAFIKAQAPQFDVSDAVHDPGCLAINGMFCLPSLRGRGLGGALLGKLASCAVDSGKSLMSVDCETTNPEAYGFWTRSFAPATWSWERRV